MAATPEKKVKQKVRALLDSLGASHFMPATHGYGKSGVADIVACYQGRFIAIECKATAEDKPTALQKLYAREVHVSGGIVLLIHNGNTELVMRALLRIQNRGEWNNHDGYPGLFDE